jgi:DNA recombination protein RmuC
MDLAVIIIVSLSLAANIILLIVSRLKGENEFKRELDSAVRELKATFNTANEYSLGRLEKDNKDKLEEISRFIKTNEEQFKEIKKELGEVIDNLLSKISNSLRETREDNAKALEKVREENTKKLDEIRGVVDEKLQEGLENRFNEKFKVISERLDSVNKGLGEMRTLSEGVKDIKVVFSNIKQRGTWGERHLQGLLDDTIPGQYYSQHQIPGMPKDSRVDFAIRMPGIDEKEVLLPVDCKFPVEAYTKLAEASDNADIAGIEAAHKEFCAAIKKSAADIKNKYINPPHTTHYAIMYLPSEGIYAEVLRDTVLVEEVFNRNNILPAGPSSILAILNTLKVGFRSVAIQKSASEIVNSFIEIKRMLATYDSLIDRAKANIDKASGNMDEFKKKNATLTRKLGKIEELGIETGQELLEE